MAAWHAIARDAQRYRDATVDAVEPSLPSLPDGLSHNVIDFTGRTLSHEEVVLTQTPPTELLELLATSKVTATAVATAFLRRAAIAKKLVR